LKSKNMKKKILIIGGHDPSGGAGVMMDANICRLNECHPLTLITSETVQNSQKSKDNFPATEKVFKKQLDFILDDMKPDAIKIGLIGSYEIARVIKNFLVKTKMPVVIDPVIGPTSGKSFLNKKAIEFMRDELLPLASIVTPNEDELLKLSNKNNIENSIRFFYELGIKNTLVTGKIKNNKIVNYLFSDGSDPLQFKNHLLKGNFHGTGCMLSSLLTIFLAKKFSVVDSCEKASNQTSSYLKLFKKIGKGQKLL